MKFGPIPVGEAAGAFLAHSAKLPGRKLKKGQLLSEEDVALLQEAGIESVIVARLDADDVPEDEAAAAVCAALAAGRNLRAGEAFTGRCNLIAEEHGVLAVDREKLDRLNLIDEAVTVATLEPFDVVAPGQMVATIKIIPFAVRRPVLDTVLAVANDADQLIGVSPFGNKKIGLIQTRLPGLKESVLDKTLEITETRVADFGSHIFREIRCGHDHGEVTRSLYELKRGGADLFLIFGASATVDREDVAPGAVVEAGGTIEHFGMPVDPGNLLFVGHWDEAPVIGMPGCARSPKLNGFDWVLWRALADLPVTGTDIMRMGAGGLLKEISERGQQRDLAEAAAAASSPETRTAAIVLAAGASRRMGPANKLLADVDGAPMVRRVVETVLDAVGEDVIVVTGHEPEKVGAALAGLPVTLVRNPDHASGMSTSLKSGLSALPDGIAAAVICLGDMPLVTAGHIRDLIRAFDPVEGRAICVPVHGRKRGNPVLWGAQFFGEMLHLSGDVGARHLLEDHADKVHEVIIEDDGVLFDVDTPERLASLAETSNSAA